MAQPFRQRSQSFVVRLWLEDEASPRWRGQIEHVGTQEKAHFKDPDGLMESLLRWIPEFVSEQTQHLKEAE